MTTPTNEAGHGLPELRATEFCADHEGTERLYTADQMRQYARAALALSRGVPADMVLVPREPTDDMLEAYQEAMCGLRNMTSVDDSELAILWKSMLAAAPAAAGAQGEGDTSRPGMSYWAVQLPGKMPRLYGAYAFAELNWYPDEGGALVRLQELERIGDPTTPQPAAADGGVRERARALFDAMLAAPYGSTTMGDIVCAETTCNRLESAWLPILEAALSSHRQAGEDCREVMCSSCGKPTMHLGPLCFSCTKARSAARSGGGGSVVKFSDTDGVHYEIHHDPIP